MPEYHTKITGFDERVCFVVFLIVSKHERHNTVVIAACVMFEIPVISVQVGIYALQVKVMSSMRRPKRLIIRGDDECDHPFLVKGGEDLRQDQRIEQLFAVMNILLSHDATCTRRGLQLRTYQVIPLTTRY